MSLKPTAYSHNDTIAYPPPPPATLGTFIGIDCLSLPQHFSGAAYYIYHLTRNLLESARPFSFAIFCKPVHRPLFARWLKPGDKLVSVPLSNRAAQLYFYEFRLGRLLVEAGIKIFYATHYICPPQDSRYCLVNTFHDMGFLLYPHYYPPVKRWYFGMRMRTFLQRTNHVVAVSRSTAASIAALFPEYRDKISVIYPGTDHLLTEPETPYEDAVMRPYILAVNTLEIRKHTPFIVHVFNYLRDNFPCNHRLLIVGQRANGYHELRRAIRQSPYRADILLENAVSSAKLMQYYRECDFFINASVYEGFGFTPFEAIQFDCPVFLYRNNTVREIIGNHPYTFPDLQAERWGETIWAALNNRFANRISRKYLQPYSWKSTTRATLNLFHKMLSGEESHVA